MGLFTTKKPKKEIKVAEMEEEEEEEEEEDDMDEEEEEEEEEEEPVKKPKKSKKVQHRASKGVTGTPKQELSQEQLMAILQEIDLRLTRLERHSILVGARD